MVDIQEVEEAAALLAEIKEEWFPDKPAGLRLGFQEAKRDLVTKRQAWRIQEESAGNRTGAVGGDAYGGTN